jgi:hypothetical protein
VAESTESPETSGRRGRPRSADTLERDQVVADALVKFGVQTKEQLAEALSLKPTLVYLSLWRLRKEDRVRRVDADGQHAWELVDA